MDLQQIEALLESDDEFPSSYNEEPSVPAYQNDYRFEPILFKWIDNQTLDSENKKKSQLSNNFRNGYIKSGYLSQTDLFCLKSVAKKSSDNAFLWFVDFLVRKDFQSRYGNKLKSCLVAKYPEKYDLPKNGEFDGQTFCKKYKIVVKMPNITMAGK